MYRVQLLNETATATAQTSRADQLSILSDLRHAAGLKQAGKACLKTAVGHLASTVQVHRKEMSCFVALVVCGTFDFPVCIPTATTTTLTTTQLIAPGNVARATNCVVA